jgi:hypothetical protein
MQVIDFWSSSESMIVKDFLTLRAFAVLAQYARKAVKPSISTGSSRSALSEVPQHVGRIFACSFVSEM